MLKTFEELCDVVTCCKKCPRLVAFRETVAIKACFKEENSWRKPVSGFGDKDAWLLLLGLAPSAQGGNRTGRIFTGDGTGKFLMQALYKAGFANIPTSLSRDDGLKLSGCYLTAAVKCVPPKNLPFKEEELNCSPYFINEISLLTHLRVVLVLGRIAFDAYKFFMKSRGFSTDNMVFQHGAFYQTQEGISLVVSYHPSPQNTQTGVLTEKMFLDLLEKIRLMKKTS